MNNEAYRQDFEELHKPVQLQVYAPRRIGRRRYIGAIERVAVALAVAVLILGASFLD